MVVRYGDEGEPVGGRGTGNPMPFSGGQDHGNYIHSDSSPPNLDTDTDDRSHHLMAETVRAY